MKRPTTIKKVLRKLSNNQKLNKQEKKTLEDLVSVLNRALKGKSLNEEGRAIIKETIQKSRQETLTDSDILTLVIQMFQVGLIFKDYT